MLQKKVEDKRKADVEDTSWHLGISSSALDKGAVGEEVEWAQFKDNKAGSEQHMMLLRVTLSCPFLLQTWSEPPGPGLEDASERDLEASNGGCLGPARLLPAECWRLAGGARMRRSCDRLGLWGQKSPGDCLLVCVSSLETVSWQGTCFTEQGLRAGPGPRGLRQDSAKSGTDRWPEARGGKAGNDNLKPTCHPAWEPGGTLCKWVGTACKPREQKELELFLQISGTKWTLVSKICYHKHSKTPLKTENFGYKP